MKTILETPRLILREMSQADYPALANILRDEQTMSAYEGAFSDEETIVAEQTAYAPSSGWVRPVKSKT